MAVLQSHTRNESGNGQDKESRSSVILRDYWNKLRGKRPYPRENEINPDEIAEIWASCFLVSIDDVTHRMGFRYSYLGDKLIEAYGDDLRNPEIVMNLLSTGNPALTEKFNEVLKKKEPTWVESEFTNIKRESVKFRVSIFPLGKNDRVTHILGCMRWRMY
jgi:hypothetical protein